MPVKPPQLRLLVGLALLMTAEPAVAKVAVATALTVVLTQHVETHTTSTAVKSRKLVEERVFPFLTVTHTVGNDLWSFAGKLIPKIKFDELYMRNYRVDLKQYLDYVPIAEAIDKLLEKTEDVETLFCSPLVLIWFGTRSPDDQKLAINLLAAKLRENARTKFRLRTIFQKGKEEDNGHFRGLAAAVEKRCLMDMATDEMYEALELPSNLNNEEFVKLGGLSIWKRFGELENEVFDTLMLTIMRERSQDEIMWAGVIYKLRNDKKMEFSLSGVFDGLLRSYDADAGDYRPSEGVQFLRSPELMDVFNDVTLTGKEAGTAALKKLLERSKDELMWARLIYMLQTDESVPTIPSDVFDALLQPYDIASYGQHQCTPSQAVAYLLGSEFFELYSSELLTSNDIHELLLTELRTKSLDELMWAKLLYMLQNDESVFSPFSSVLEALVKSWTVAVQSTFRENNVILSKSKLVDLSMYGQFLSNNPNVFVVEKLRERSTDECMWAQILYILRMDQDVATDVLDTLLHSWIGRPYDAAAATANKHTLIDAYDNLINRALTVSHRLEPLTGEEANALVEDLRKRSKDDFMWAKFLYKLQQDETFSVFFSSVFDTLIQSYDATNVANMYTPSASIKFLKSLEFSQMYAVMLSKANADEKMLTDLFTKWPNEVMWAKLLYMLQSDESESKAMFSSLLTTLLQSWISPIHGVAEVTEQSGELDKSVMILKSQRFISLYEYAQFMTDNPFVFVLEKLREQSRDDVMWARLLYTLRRDKNKEFIMSGVLDALLHSMVGRPYDALAVTAIKHTLIDAYENLVNCALTVSHRLEPLTGEEANTFVNELRKRSKDEFMWAKFLYKLQQDDTVSDIFSSVFDALIEPCDATHAVQLSTPSSCIVYLLNSNFVRLFTRKRSRNNAVEQWMTYLLSMSSNEVLWAKLFYMLQSDESESKNLFSSLLTTLLQSWISPIHGVAEVSEQSGVLDKCAMFLKSQKFISLYEYAQFSSDNPFVFVLEKLREQSRDDFMWARLLNSLRKYNKTGAISSGVLDALLHSWVGKPFDAAASTAKERILIDAYNKLIIRAVPVPYRLESLTGEEANELVNGLRERSKDDFMWAKFLYKLQQDDDFSVFSFKVFDALIQSYDATNVVNMYTPSASIHYLKSLEFSQMNAGMLINSNANEKLLTYLFTKWPNEVMWAKLLYMLQSDESESKPMFSSLLTTLLQSWITSIHGVAEVSEQSGVLDKSVMILKSQKIFSLYEYAQFSSDNAYVYVLERLLEHSRDDFMWARLLNTMRKNKDKDAIMSGVLDALLHSWAGRPYDALAVTATKHSLIDAYDNLMIRAVAVSHSLEPLTVEEADTFVKELRKRSKDEFMWAKFLHKLQQDDTVSDFFSSVFDALIEPYDATNAAGMYTPSASIQYLMSSAFSQKYASMFFRSNLDEVMLAALFTLSSDTLTWAKLLCMLQSDKSHSKPMYSRLLKAILQWWMTPIHRAGGIAEQPNIPHESAMFLKSQNFLSLYKYAQFSNDNPNLFVLEKLREHSRDDFIWARLLNTLRKDRKTSGIMSGVLDALLHSWVGRPYDAAAARTKPKLLLRCYDYLMSKEGVSWYDTMKLTGTNFEEEIPEVMLQILNDKVVWTKLLSILQNDESVRVPLS